MTGKGSKKKNDYELYVKERRVLFYYASLYCSLSGPVLPWLGYLRIVPSDVNVITMFILLLVVLKSRRTILTTRFHSYALILYEEYYVISRYVCLVL